MVPSLATADSSSFSSAFRDSAWRMAKMRSCFFIAPAASMPRSRASAARSATFRCLSSVRLEVGAGGAAGETGVGDVRGAEGRRPGRGRLARLRGSSED